MDAENGFAAGSSSDHYEVFHHSDDCMGNQPALSPEIHTIKQDAEQCKQEQMHTLDDITPSNIFLNSKLDYGERQQQNEMKKFFEELHNSTYLEQEIAKAQNYIRALESECSDLRSSKKGLEIQIEQLKLKNVPEESIKVYDNYGNSASETTTNLSNFKDSFNYQQSDGNEVKPEVTMKSYRSIVILGGDKVKHGRYDAGVESKLVPGDVFQSGITKGVQCQGAPDDEKPEMSTEGSLVEKVESNSLLEKVVNDQRLALNKLRYKLHMTSSSLAESAALMKKLQEENDEVQSKYNEMTSKCKMLSKEKTALEDHLARAMREKRLEVLRIAQEKEVLHKYVVKEIDKLKDERDAAVAEHHLVMSERDVVHGEINQLQDHLAEQTKLLQEAQQKILLLEANQRKHIESISEEDKVMLEFDQVLEDRGDNRTKDIGPPRNVSSRNFYNSFGQKSSRADEVLSQNSEVMNVEMMRMIDDYMATASLWMQDSFKENDSLKRQLQQKVNEFSTLFQELSESKSRCDWAFSERDKIVKERDSMRTMCDKLRQDRDNAVNELIKAIKDSDDLKKQRNQAINDLKTFKEMFRMSSAEGSVRSQEEEQLISHSYSKDSAIDSDFQEWETEIINLDIPLKLSLQGIDEKGDLGFELGGGGNERSSTRMVFIKNILPCSPAYGVIQVNDQLVQVNSVEVSGLDKSIVCQLIRYSPRPVHVVVKRKKPCPKLFSTNQSNFQSNSLQRRPKLPSSSFSIAPHVARNFSSNNRANNSCDGTEWPSELTQNTLQSSNNFSKKTKESEVKLVEGNSAHSSSSYDGLNGSANEEVFVSCEEHVKTKKNLFNKAFTAIARSFKSSTKDSRCKSSHNYATNNAPVAWLDGSHGIIGKKSVKSSHHDTWPKCRNQLLSSCASGKKSRPMLNLPHDDRTRPGDAAAGTSRPEETSSVVADGDRKKTSEREKDSYVYHCAQMSDPTSYASVRDEGTIEKLGIRSFSGSAQSQPLPKIDKRVSVSKHITENPVSEAHQNGINVVHLHDSLVKLYGKESEKPHLLDDHHQDDYRNHVRTWNATDRQTFRSGISEGESNVVEKVPGDQLAIASTRVSLTTDIRVTQATYQSQHNTRNLLNFCNLPFPVNDTNSDVDSTPSRKITKPPRDGHIVYKTFGNIPVLPTSCNQSSSAPVFDSSGGTNVRPIFMYNAAIPASKIANQPSNVTLPLAYLPPLPVSANSSVAPFFLLPNLNATKNSDRYFLTGNEKISGTGSVRHAFNRYPNRNQPSQFYVGTLSERERRDFENAKANQHLEANFNHLQHQEHLIQKILKQHGSEHVAELKETRKTRIANSLGSFQQSPERNVYPSSQSNKTAANILSEYLNRFKHKPQTPTGSVGIVTAGKRQSASSSLDGNSQKQASVSSWADIGDDQLSLSLIGMNQPSSSRMTRSHIETRKSSTPRKSFESSGSVGVIALSVSDSLATSITEDCDSILGDANKVAGADKLKGHQSSVSIQSSPPDYRGSLENSFGDFHKEYSTASTRGPGTFESNGKSTDDNLSSSEEQPRVIVRHKAAQESIKVDVIGGNAVGIFVSFVYHDSVMGGPDGVRVGDQILKYNERDFGGVFLEEAVLEMRKPCTEIKCTVQHLKQRFNQIQNQPGDSIYVRALRDHGSAGGGELSFSSGDVLHVDNTFFNNKFGVWWAYLFNQEGQKTKCGTIVCPSGRQDDDNNVSKCPDKNPHDIGGCDGRIPSNAAPSGSGSLRRSFFKHRKHQRNNSKEDAASETSFCEDVFSPPSSSPYLSSFSLLSAPDVTTKPFGLFQRVEMHKPSYARPVLIVGPFADEIISKLVTEFPLKFYRFIPEFGSKFDYKESVTYRTLNGGASVISVHSLKESMKMGYHCLMNFPPEVVTKFQPYGVHFIVLFIKFKSHKQIKETKESQFFQEKMTSKMSRDLLDRNVEMEKKFKHLFSEVIQGGSLSHMCCRVKEAVEREQNKKIWVPYGSL